METNMKATLCEHTLDNDYLVHSGLRGAIVHFDRGHNILVKPSIRLLLNTALFKA